MATGLDKAVQALKGALTSKEETPKEDAPEESHDADETGDSSSEN